MELLPEIRDSVSRNWLKKFVEKQICFNKLYSGVIVIAHVTIFVAVIILI